ncbi:hypothetical protein TNCV_1479651 [Trichonephila clavipes]|nr:hypothetical protein TNCV_1479651 [Trichonephila clavipes]
MVQQLRVQRPPIHSISDLRYRCLNIWYNLPPVIYQGLVASTPSNDVEDVPRSGRPEGRGSLVVMVTSCDRLIHGFEPEW